MRLLHDHEQFDVVRFNRALIFSGNDPRLRQDEEYMKARRQYLEATFDGQYPDLVRVLRIPRETANRVVELSVEQQMRQSGVRVDVAEQRAFWLELRQKTYEADAEIAALVGEAKLRQWKDYEASLSERHQVRQLRFELIDSSEPLGSDKAESLIRALYEERQRIERDARAKWPESTLGEEPQFATFVAPEDAAEFEAESERRTFNAAEKVLSPVQFEAFRKMLERQWTAQSAMERMDHAGREALK